MKKLIPILFTILCVFSNLSAQEVVINITSFADGFSSPVDLQNAGDDRLFVVEQGGRIKILNSDGTTNATPFLDISGLVSTGSEQGLLGLAFHPDYATNGYFYVNYTDLGEDTQIARFSVSGDPDIADAGSEFNIMSITQPFPNHNGGAIAFGDDGMLFISTGDGGSGGDPGNRAQNTELLLGKLLRIDVDNPGGGNNYGIPSDNPFAGSPTDAEEIWAYGLRNAWRFSFDSMTGDIWMGDVGQQDMEEINYAEGTTAGINYGWRCYEGTLPYNTTGCPAPGTLIFPIGEYSSASGTPHCSVTGGYVYRGSDSPAINGYYFFADYCSGLIGTIHDLSSPTLIDHGTFGGNWSTFGEDVNNELYIVDISGEIFKISGEPVLGISDFDTNEVILYPNPASAMVTLQAESTSVNAYSIMDMKGSVISSENGLDTQVLEVDTSVLSKGLYLMTVTTEKGNTLIKKLVIQ
ncbi:MAG: T9SS type A sorting domain-containing protein [Flavobacteriaceae bacterium]|nr:T9SS type A sorting domain-containing protein [Flavobacteriaceae bacterium]